MNYVRHCPRCQTARPLTEIVCLGTFHDAPCHWSLFDILPTPENEAIQAPISHTPTTAANPPTASLLCSNGHPLAPGDFLCLECGEPAATPDTKDPPSATVPTCMVQGWLLGDALVDPSADSDLFLASKDDTHGVVKLYRRGIEPDLSLYPSLRALDAAHAIRLIESGRYDDCAFEVWEHLPLGSLADLPENETSSPELARSILTEISSALQELSRLNLIHCDLQPANILVRSREPLDLVLADFSTATFSEFDLQFALSRQTARYAAPETIAGTCSAASDWWSLGVILLELLTAGRDFKGIHERAFLLHLITRGLQVPTDLPPNWQELLKGLLTRDPSLRWNGSQVQRWLAGERGIPHGYTGEKIDAPPSGITLRLGETSWPTPESFALAAVDAAHWDEARDILFSGKLATWLKERGGDADHALASQIRNLAADNALTEDARLAAAMMELNPHLPLCHRGEIVTPNWILSHPDIAWQWLDSPLPQRLRRNERETWFVKIHERAELIRKRKREQKIDCDDAQLSAAMLATSRIMLENGWAQRRKFYPEAEHPALVLMLQRRVPTEEELILLISASAAWFRPSSDVLDEAEKEARRAQVPFPREQAAFWFEKSRAAILDAVAQRLENFVRCGQEVADQWADDFRQDRRITLARALVLLAIPADDWHEPPRQEYVRNILHFFHRRLVTGLQRGGLIRMTIGRTTARLDLTELSGPARSANAILSSILSRENQPLSLDPTPLSDDTLKENRLRRLTQNTTAYRRDTGINPLFLGFPFILLRDARTSDAAKPRIAPVLLWPVKIEMPSGQRSTVKISFDAEREVRLNPALEGLLGPVFTDWQETLNDLRSRDHLDLQTIIDALAHLAIPPLLTHSLAPLPPITAKVAPGRTELHPSAVLFQCDFSGQTIAEDIKQLANGTPIHGTALEIAIRAGESIPPSDKNDTPPEIDRYFTAASDPSQQAAVFRARHAPGLVVQGPPGTGKSQTIVNIVCDSIGRDERVLIVCQKQAALEVVRKRLDTEGLGDRLFYLKDPNSDRRPALQELRKQLENPAHSPQKSASIQREREGIAHHIEALEYELNSAHRALHEVPPDQPGNRSYRELLDELMEIEAQSIVTVTLPGAGALLSQTDHSAAWQLISEIAPLTPLWLAAHFEDSPLHHLTDFDTNNAAINDLQHTFNAFEISEKNRNELLSKHHNFFHPDSPEALKNWLAENESALRKIPHPIAKQLAKWATLLKRNQQEDSRLEKLLAWLAYLSEKLKILDRWTIHSAIYPELAACGDTPLKSLSQAAAVLAREPTSFFALISPTRYFRKRRLHRWLRQSGARPENIDLTTLHAAAELEATLRPDRPALHDWLTALDMQPTDGEISLPTMRQQVLTLNECLAPVIAAARSVQTCPIESVATSLHASGDPSAYASIIDDCHASLALHTANQCSLNAIEKLRPWFSHEWIEARRSEIHSRQPAASTLQSIAAAFPTLTAFQTFRLRARALNPNALPLFAKLRQKQRDWESIPLSSLPTAVTHTLRRETLLEWKRQIEITNPSLLMERNEFEQKVALLAEKDDALRKSNQLLLSRCHANAPITTGSAWDDVTMFTGPRARRLREVVERGEPLGLFHLRPVWMVNPEMVSRLFPLKAGLFDVVIFDEASQLPVENALPSLFRAKRMVVSGDEKQMPPSRFFGSHLDTDEEVENADVWLDADDANLGDAEREQLAQAAGRREVKDCPDLLTLSQNLLPTATLEIHYRSKYRQLIDFSNAAFYNNRLSVPARHPESEIFRARPIEVDRVDGEYRDQTNEAEAAHVVARLREIWLRPAKKRPSIGVVTFNLKQAELIYQHLEVLAENDPAFHQAWGTETLRMQDGEDMGFFVKNLENVQGDERDWIIFSTTFGRDATGNFRRNFGVLGQHGGERRLNVAVTRAREKVLLVTSMPVGEISNWTAQSSRRVPTIPRDFLQGWLTYAERIDSGDLAQSQLLLHSLAGENPALSSQKSYSQNRSRFIEEVADFIRHLGHDPIPSLGDAFGLDFAIKDPTTGHFGLGIECDSHQHEVLQSARARELWRPSVLKNSIRAIHRVNSREWYHNCDTAKKRLQIVIQKSLHT